MAEGRRDDATWAAAGAVPLLGKGLKAGVTAREVTTTVTPEVVHLIAAATARRIAGGHAWTKHVVGQAEFPEITTPQQFADLIEDVLLTGASRPSLTHPGKTYYWKGDTFVVIDPKNPDGGTAFRPPAGREYFEIQK